MSSSDVGFYSRYVKKWRHFMQIRRKRKEPNGGRW